MKKTRVEKRKHTLINESFSFIIQSLKKPSKRIKISPLKQKFSSSNKISQSPYPSNYRKQNKYKPSEDFNPFWNCILNPPDYRTYGLKNLFPCNKQKPRKKGELKRKTSSAVKILLETTSRKRKLTKTEGENILIKRKKEEADVLKNLKQLEEGLKQENIKTKEFDLVLRQKLSI
eukprot:snap_masked-scaffold_21-processed-gene-1.17-mRNA-1 protein AED:1.00 eAED:1.00 QI:0/-1/0/0/-1/1/1/0/174